MARTTSQNVLLGSLLTPTTHSIVIYYFPQIHLLISNPDVSSKQQTQTFKLVVSALTEGIRQAENYKQFIHKNLRSLMETSLSRF